MDLTTIIIIFCLALLLGIGSTYLLIKPKLEATQKLDEEIVQKNKQLVEQYQLEQNNLFQLKTEKEQLTKENIQLSSQKQLLTNENIKLSSQKQSISEQINILNNNFSKMEKQAQEAADLFYKSKMEIAEKNLAQSLEKEAQKYQDNITAFENQYNETIEERMKQYKDLEDNIAQLKATNDAAVAAAKRAEESRNQQNYYRIQLSAADIHEIELLRQIEPYLREKEPLNKVIWKCYYEKPTTDLIGRVIGSGIHTGIYKITEIASGKCYVGQAANLSDRWKQHIKRGIGADTPTRNKLYPAMIAAGPENFTFEIIEECDRAKLDEREDYWQEYFKTKEFGYSIK